MSILSNRLPTVRQLQCFIAVAEELNFRRAAERLHMSQPPLSRQVRSLETLLGVTLIERDTHRVALTPTGKHFVDEAHRLLVGLNQAVASLRDSAAQQQKSIRLGLTSVMDFSQLPTLNALLSNPPFNRGIHQERAYSKRLVERVLALQIDLAIVGVFADASPALKSRKIGEDTMMVALPASHTAANKQRIDLKDIADIPLFWFPRANNPTFYDRCEALFNQLGFSAPRKPEPQEHVDLLARIAAGEGMGFLPSSMQAASRTGVVYRAFTDSIEARLSMDVHLIWRTDERSDAVLDVVNRLLSAIDTQALTPFIPSSP
ncbi:LysR family transcriptional regulator [Halomonas sp. M20]|uniref:LysR family transcriptional regulator n=1 Tax=Halomonas sp. M20 TaxID=2763264 RepID=UPI001D0A9EAA|nr:LysR family transcriptional regulator [Halomonas sp. M20]